jgi:hypothetical protein
LNTYQFDELVKMLEASIAQGDYGAGKAFDITAATALRKQGEDFANLPAATAGDRALAESINHPLDLLTARYQAMSSEASNFKAKMASLGVLLEKEQSLIDFLLAASDLEYWSTRQPQISGADRFAWNFAAGRGLNLVRAYPLTVCADPVSY